MAGDRRIKLFVYGSLLHGEPAHHRLRGARLVASASTDACFTLVALDGYPALVESGDTAVTGEIYAVDQRTLAELDVYEDAPALYERRSLRVGGHDVVAYVLPVRLAAGRRVITSGDWRRR